MPLQNLYIVGAATWPDAGTDATSGYLAAKKILRKRGALRDRLAKGGAAVGVAAAATLVARRLAGAGGRPRA